MKNGAFLRRESTRFADIIGASCHLKLPFSSEPRGFDNTAFSVRSSVQMSPDAPKMSQATKDILLKVRKMIPPMLEKFHKGTPHPTPRPPSSSYLMYARTNGQSSSNRRQRRLHRSSLFLCHGFRAFGVRYGKSSSAVPMTSLKQTANNPTLRAM
jgi:hypothetical protein